MERLATWAHKSAKQGAARPWDEGLAAAAADPWGRGVDTKGSLGWLVEVLARLESEKTSPYMGFLFSFFFLFLFFHFHFLFPFQFQINLKFEF